MTYPAAIRDVVELSFAELALVSGGAEPTRKCEGPTVCDDKGYCEDDKGVCRSE